MQRFGLWPGRIVLPGPALNLSGRDVGLVVVFRVALAAVGHQLDEGDALAPAGAVPATKIIAALSFSETFPIRTIWP